MPTVVLPSQPIAQAAKNRRRNHSPTDAISPGGSPRAEETKDRVASRVRLRVWQRLVAAALAFVFPGAAIACAAFGIRYGFLSEKTTQVLLFGGLAGMLAGTFIAFLIVRGTTRSLDELAAQAMLVAEGKRTDLAFRRQGDEIGDLADAFSRVLDSSRRDRERLMTSNKDLLGMNEQLQNASEQVKSFALDRKSTRLNSSHG